MSVLVVIRSAIFQIRDLIQLYEQTSILLAASKRARLESTVRRICRLNELCYQQATLLTRCIAHRGHDAARRRHCNQTRNTFYYSVYTDNLLIFFNDVRQCKKYNITSG